LSIESNPLRVLLAGQAGAVQGLSKQDDVSIVFHGVSLSLRLLAGRRHAAFSGRITQGKPRLYLDTPVRARLLSSSNLALVTCDRVRSCIRLLCGEYMSAGWYGAAWLWCEITSAGSCPVDPDAFFQNHRQRSLVLTVYDHLTRRCPISYRLSNVSRQPVADSCNFLPSFHRPKRPGHLVD